MITALHGWLGEGKPLEARVLGKDPFEIPPLGGRRHRLHKHLSRSRRHLDSQRIVGFVPQSSIQTLLLIAGGQVVLGVIKVGRVPLAVAELGDVLLNRGDTSLTVDPPPQRHELVRLPIPLLKPWVVAVREVERKKLGVREERERWLT